MFFPRQILPALENELHTNEITVLTGMRQVGKTTLLKYLYEKIPSSNKVFLDAENPLHRKVFEEENYDAIWHNLASFNVKSGEKAHIFIDEVQKMPSLASALKYLYDHYQTKFFLTGSSSFYLKNLFPESLAGRKIVFELFPLTFSEFLVFRGKNPPPAMTFSKKSQSKNEVAYQLLRKDYDEYLSFGGFPKVVLEGSPERKKLLLEEIFTSYFENDVKSLADFKESSKIRDLILILPSRIGSKVEIAKISSELSVSRGTVYSYLEFLEKTYFISLLPKHSASYDRAAAGSKKVFLCDCGLAQRLGQISAGQALENSVFQNLRPQHQLAYYTGASGGEIDFIVDGRIALEVKLTASQRDLANLKRSAQALGAKEAYLATLALSPLADTIPATEL